MTSFDWLPDLIDEWPFVPIGLLGTMTKIKNEGLKEKNLLSLSYGNVVRKDINEQGGLRPESYETYQIVEAGDTILRFTDLQNDKKSLRSGYVRERGIMTSAYINFRPDPRVLDGRFFALMMRTIDQKKVFYRMGSGVRQSLNYSEFSALAIPLPPLDTQRRIAEYLDTETAQIDAMMAKLDELVELLGERRASVVRTLLDDAPTEGEAPLYLALSRHFPGEWGVDEGKGEFDVKCVRVADFNRETKTVNSDVETIRSVTKAKFNDKKLQLSDILVERSGGSKKKPVGNAFLYSGDDDAICANFIQVLRLNSDNDPKFWNYLLAQSYDRGDFNVLYNQTTGIQNLQMDLFLQKRYPVIPLDEQRRIAEHIDTATARIDTMIDKCNELRELLQERRSALITAVVTGQKEVPNV